MATPLGPTGGFVVGSILISDAGLRTLAKRTTAAVEDVIEKAAQDAAGFAAQNIRDVGAIDTSFMVNTTQARRLGRMLWSIGTAAHYGVFIEYGTRYVGARPWLVPAMRKITGTLDTLLRNALRD